MVITIKLMPELNLAELYIDDKLALKGESDMYIASQDTWDLEHGDAPFKDYYGLIFKFPQLEAEPMNNWVFMPLHNTDGTYPDEWL